MFFAPGLADQFVAQVVRVIERGQGAEDVIYALRSSALLDDMVDDMIASGGGIGKFVPQWANWFGARSKAQSAVRDGIESLICYKIRSAYAGHAVYPPGCQPDDSVYPAVGTPSVPSRATVALDQPIPKRPPVAIGRPAETAQYRRDHPGS